MQWLKLKAILLEAGGVRLEGKPVDKYLARSTAGPGAGGPGSVFFTTGKGRVRLSLRPDSPISLLHRGDGRVTLQMGSEKVEGRLEKVALHCPRQAYLTISEGCIYGCRYCQVPAQQNRVKTVEEMVSLIRSVADRIDAIAITSGVTESPGEEERITLALVQRVRPLGIPIGVSIYPTRETPARLYEARVDEVKFNLETATEALFREMCPGLDRHLIQEVLDRSVILFGRNHVFSNVIVGLGESDTEMEECMQDLAGRGVIPVLRPLQPAAAIVQYPRPSAKRLLHLFRREQEILEKAGLDPGQALTMCVSCTGCDLVPGRDV
ncbi:MAG: radical SAM protein [Methanomicrobiales archaeon]|nr:radical SAM protein [Methanomicrobiales archaeon]